MSQRSPTKIFGTVKLDDNASIKQTEVTLQEWIYFIINNDFDDTLFPDDKSISQSTKKVLDDLKKKNNSEYFKIIDNSSAMRRNFGDKGLHINFKNYDNLEKADTNDFSLNIPITGITFKQANQYCKWKEEVSNRSGKYNIKVSLPSVEFYAKVIPNKDSICNNRCDSCHQYFYNYRSSHCNSRSIDKYLTTQGQGPVRADRYLPTTSGLYCVQGNVAEMTDEEGVAMGGSFRHFARQSFNDQKQLYSKAEDWLGFRFIVTLQ